MELEKLILKCIWKNEGPSVAETVSKKSKAGAGALPGGGQFRELSG